MSETIKLSRLKPNPNNPRVIRDHKFEKLCKSIETFPKMMKHRPIVVDADYVILGGNMRLRALQHLGFKEIPADWVSVASEFTEEEKPEFVIKDNTNFGEWDNEALANEWDDKPLEDWGHDVPRWDDSKLISLINGGDENSEWIGMPEFEKDEGRPKLIISFDSENDMQIYIQENGIKIIAKNKKTWSASYPFRDKEQLVNMKYE